MESMKVTVVVDRERDEAIVTIDRGDDYEKYRLTGLTDADCRTIEGIGADEIEAWIAWCGKAERLTRGRG